MALPIEINYLRKEELVYELKFRGFPVTDSQTVDELRKCLRPILKLEKQNTSFSFSEYSIDIASELELLERKFSELKVLVDDYVSTPDKHPQSLRVRLHHYLNRINRILPKDLSAEQSQRRTTLLANFWNY